MKVLVAVDAQLFRTEDGKVWTPTIYGYEFWTRYLDIFEEVVVVSRIKNASFEEVKGFLRSDGEHITFRGLPFARGAKEYIKKFNAFRKEAKNAVEDVDCAIIRLPSIAATFIEYYFRKTQKPYVLEVVVDPNDAYAENKIAKELLTWHLKKAVLHANGVSYVTQFFLQKEYPSYSIRYGEDKTHFDTYYSSIMLKKDFFGEAKKFVNHPKKYKIVHTANNVNNYIKGHDVLINAVKILRDGGYDIEVIFIGDGKKREEFLNLADSLGIRKYVNFTGLLPSASEVRKVLIDSDMFVFPTKAEGLPRAVIEAMAVGLPCISTPVNGIPELLDREFLLNPNDTEGFAEKISFLVDNPLIMEKCSLRNISKAYEYEQNVLQSRRNKFYTKLRELAINNVIK